MRTLTPVLFSVVVASAGFAQAPGPAIGAGPQTPPSAPAPVPAAAPATSWTEEHDALYKIRDQPGVEQKLSTMIAQAVAKDPKDYEAWWRKAQLACWRANGMADGSDLKAMAGKACMEAGEKAIELNANDVKGTYWAGVGIGVYSEGVGILAALTQGLEGKFRERTQAAMKLDESYNEGGPRQLWGRYFYKLPWPKRDVDESVRQLEQSNKAYPNNLRTRLYLADSYDSNGKKAEAQALVKAIVEAAPRDPEDKRVIELAKKWLKDHD